MEIDESSLEVEVTVVAGDGSSIVRIGLLEVGEFIVDCF